MQCDPSDRRHIFQLSSMCAFTLINARLILTSFFCFSAQSYQMHMFSESFQTTLFIACLQKIYALMHVFRAHLGAIGFQHAE